MTERRSSTSSPTADACRVLLVDDDVDYIDITRRQLELRGFVVFTANGGTQGLERLQQQRPDVVLLDVMMPGMSGFEVLQRIRETPATASLPVILISAKGDEEDMMTGYQYGADYYITKPCTTTQLLYGVGLVLGRNFGDADDSAAATAAPRRVIPRAAG